MPVGNPAFLGQAHPLLYHLGKRKAKTQAQNK